jgi:HK97 gp10 family phage protein
VKAEVKLNGLEGVLDILQGLPKEVVSKRGGPVRAALRKGALKIYKPAKQYLAISTESEESTGLLEASLVVTRGKPPTDGKGERYLIRVKRKNYQRKGKAVTTLKTAHLLEYGSSTQPAEPWLRPAFNQNAAAAITETEQELLKSIDRIVRKLGKKGGLS